MTGQDRPQPYKDDWAGVGQGSLAQGLPYRQPVELDNHSSAG